jgi:hypothetical protein
MAQLLRSAAAILLVSSFAASAAPLLPDAGAMALGFAQAVRHEIHGCHYDCECGPLKDFGCEQVYHRHLHMLCLPVRCGGDTKCEQTPPQGVCRHIAPQ